MWKLQNFGHFYYYVFLLTFIIRIYIVYPRIMDKESWEKKTVVQLIFLIYLMGPTMQSIVFLVERGRESCFVFLKYLDILFCDKKLIGLYYWKGVSCRR